MTILTVPSLFQLVDPNQPTHMALQPSQSNGGAVFSAPCVPHGQERKEPGYSNLLLPRGLHKQQGVEPLSGGGGGRPRSSK